MKNKLLLSLFIFFSLLFLFSLLNCGIPQVLPYLSIPVAEKNSVSFESITEFQNFTIYFTCTNQEEYFRGYYFFYRDTDGFLKKGFFSYFNNSTLKLEKLDSIPAANELDDFRIGKDFKFIFYISNILYNNSSINNIRDSYLLLNEEEEDLYTLYKTEKNISIYLIPLGEDAKGYFIYEPAFSTSQNRVIFNFK